MRWVLVSSFMLFGQNSFCQIGFNQSYDFGQLAAAFGSLELSGEDTVVVYGIVIQGDGLNGISVTKLDTFGNIISNAEYFDTSEGDFTQVYPNSFIKLQNNSGYAGVGQVFQRDNGYFALFDYAGGLTDYIEYNDNNSREDFYKEIKELPDGFLILGDKQDTFSYIVNIFVAKTDFEGHIIWEKNFSTPNRQTRFGQILVINENEYVIGATTTPVQGVPLPQVTNTSKIFAIDSLGNVKWQWESQPSLEELGVGKLSMTDEGNWAYTSLRGWYNATYNEIDIQPKFIIRDSDFNIIREDTLGTADTPSSNGFANLFKLNDGGWMLIGVKPVNYPIPPVPMWYNSFSGWMVRLDSQGEQLWSRVDTAFWSVETGSTNYYYDAVELPSGSIVACGYSRTYEPAPKDWGWLIKVSKDGCVDTLLCNPVNTSASPMQQQALKLFPNPTSSMLHIQSEGGDIWDRIDILNMVGQIVQTFKNTGNTLLNISQIPSGPYYIRLTKDGWFVSRKIIKR